MRKRPGSKNGGAVPPAKSANVIIRVSVLEKESFKEAAILAGQALSVWIRDRLRRVAREELENGQKPVAFLQR